MKPARQNGLGMGWLAKSALPCLALIALVSCKPAQDQQVPGALRDGIVVYYLCGTFRCVECNAIESLAQAAVLGGRAENGKTGTAAEIPPPYSELAAAGRLTFLSVNVDEAPNKSLLKTFDTDPKLPVIAEFRDGTLIRFKVLKEVWKLLADDAAFIGYVQNELNEYAATMETR